MELKDVMSIQVEAISEDAPLTEAARRMSQEDIGFLPVIGDGRISGVVTDRDIVIRCVAEGEDPTLATVKSVMSRDAAILPDLLARETATTLLESIEADASVVFVAVPGGEVRVLAVAGCDAEVGRALGRAAAQGSSDFGDSMLFTEPLGRNYDGPRFCTIAAGRRLTAGDAHRLRMFAAVARQGFELCGARERPTQTLEPINERPLEPL